MTLQIQNKNLVVSGKCPRIAKLYDEYFDWIDEPCRFIDDLKLNNVHADLFTFVEKGVSAPRPQYDFYHEWDEIAVLQISTYQDWLKNRIRHDERNRLKKAGKSGIETRLVEFNDDFVKGIKEIYDESPIRQGRRFRHYQKSLEHLRQINGTFIDTCEFIGAYYQGELIGFVKVIRDGEAWYLMQLISMIKQRDKSPTDALLAKTIEVCADRGVRYLRYGNWSRRGLGDYKKNHGFEKVPVPRYYVPLNLAGKCALHLNLHRDFRELLPQRLMDATLDLRMRLTSKIADLGD
jgi:hypothetical protein